MADFSTAMAVVLRHEGLFSDDPADPGGATKYGVSLRTLKGYGAEGDFDGDGDVDREDILAMSEDQARAVYRKHWWDRFAYYAIQEQAVANKVFDLAVNMGAGAAHTLLQRALIACGQAVMVDGMFGAKTLSAVNQARPDALLAELRLLAVEKYQEIAAARPAEGAVFLRGWLRRAVA